MCAVCHQFICPPSCRAALLACSTGKLIIHVLLFCFITDSNTIAAKATTDQGPITSGPLPSPPGSCPPQHAPTTWPPTPLLSACTFLPRFWWIQTRQHGCLLLRNPYPKGRNSCTSIPEILTFPVPCHRCSPPLPRRFSPSNGCHRYRTRCCHRPAIPVR